MKTYEVFYEDKLTTVVPTTKEEDAIAVWDYGEVGVVFPKGVKRLSEKLKYAEDAVATLSNCQMTSIAFKEAGVVK